MYDGSSVEPGGHDGGLRSGGEGSIKGDADPIPGATFRHGKGAFEFRNSRGKRSHELSLFVGYGATRWARRRNRGGDEVVGLEGASGPLDLEFEHGRT